MYIAYTYTMEPMNLMQREGTYISHGGENLNFKNTNESYIL